MMGWAPRSVSSNTFCIPCRDLRKHVATPARPLGSIGGLTVEFLLGIAAHVGDAQNLPAAAVGLGLLADALARHSRLAHFTLTLVPGASSGPLARPLLMRLLRSFCRALQCNGQLRWVSMLLLEVVLRHAQISKHCAVGNHLVLHLVVALKQAKAVVAFWW